MKKLLLILLLPLCLNAAIVYPPGTGSSGSSSNANPWFTNSFNFSTGELSISNLITTSGASGGFFLKDRVNPNDVSAIYSSGDTFAIFNGSLGNWFTFNQLGTTPTATFVNGTVASSNYLGSAAYLTNLVYDMARNMTLTTPRWFDPFLDSQTNCTSVLCSNIILTMHNKGLDKAGWWFWLDAGWENTNLNANGTTMVNSNLFPAGLEPVIAYAHSFGMPIGIYHSCATNGGTVGPTGLLLSSGENVVALQAKKFANQGFDGVWIDRFNGMSAHFIPMWSWAIANSGRRMVLKVTSDQMTTADQQTPPFTNGFPYTLESMCGLGNIIMQGTGINVVNGASNAMLNFNITTSWTNLNSPGHLVSIADNVYGSFNTNGVKVGMIMAEAFGPVQVLQCNLMSNLLSSAASSTIVNFAMTNQYGLQMADDPLGVPPVLSYSNATQVLFSKRMANGTNAVIPMNLNHGSTASITINVTNLNNVNSNVPMTMVDTSGNATLWTNQVSVTVGTNTCDLYLVSQQIQSYTAQTFTIPSYDNNGLRITSRNSALNTLFYGSDNFLYLLGSGNGFTNLAIPFYGNNQTVPAFINANTRMFGLSLQTNDLGTGWPTAPYTRGEAALVNSNGTPYLLLSGANGATWLSTNDISAAFSLLNALTNHNAGAVDLKSSLIINSNGLAGQVRIAGRDESPTTGGAIYFGGTVGVVAGTAMAIWNTGSDLNLSTSNNIQFSSQGVNVMAMTPTTLTMQGSAQISAGIVQASQYIVNSNSITYTVPIMQAGKTNVTTATSIIVTFPKAMPTTNYTASLVGNGVTITNASVSLKTTTGFTANWSIAATGQFDWSIIQQTP